MLSQSQILTLILLCSLGGPAVLLAKKGGEPGGGSGGGGGPQKQEDIPVQITFANRSGDQILSVGDPTYTDGQDGVTAVIRASDGFVNLFTCTSPRPKDPCLTTGREQRFDYTWPVDGQTPYELHYAGGNWAIHPRNADLTRPPGGFRDITNFPGETKIAGMKVNYSIVYPDTDSFVNYTTRFAPLMYPDSNFVLVTFLGGVLDCTVENPAECANWSVEALTGTFDAQPLDCCPENELEDIAELVTRDNSLSFGLYHMPFKLTVTVLPR